MKRITFLILTSLLSMFFAINSTAAPKKVAIYVEGQIEEADKSIISAGVLSRMSGNKDYTPFERNDAFIKALTDEQDFQLSGEVPEKEIREVGERLGVDYVIVVNAIISSDEQCHMTARLINLTSGEILKSVTAKREYTGSEVLAKMANNVAYRLLNKKSK